jgi:UTP--glucose-1-phosphate uridylyltransferase
MHVLTSHVLDRLSASLAAASDPREVHLATALDELGHSEQHLAVELKGRRFDLDEQHGLLMAQLALALSGRERSTVLAQVVKLLAELPPA